MYTSGPRPHRSGCPAVTANASASLFYGAPAVAFVLHTGAHPASAAMHAALDEHVNDLTALKLAAARSAHGYVCAFYQVNYGAGGSCQHIVGPALDAYVTGQVLAAVAPAALEVSMAARRQYQLAEPENRLVTRQLEAQAGIRYW
jgi:hypothetical protein